VQPTGDEPSKKQGIGERFQEETKYTPEAIGGHHLDWDHMPDRYKTYPESATKIALPAPQFGDNANIWDIIRQRRSLRDYAPSFRLKLETLSALLWATQGITAAVSGYQFRTAPSAGGLYPIETYILARAVEGIDEGFYHFRPQSFDLECIRSGDFAVALARAALGQGMVARAQVTFIWTAVVARSKWKYRQRAYRYIYLDAGHIAQNLYLAGTAAGIGVCGIGAFFDDQVNALIGVDGVEETALYLASAGRPSRS
jgi:SagB-type dehydrogenase family enzyme